jgi:hypothetical protein
LAGAEIKFVPENFLGDNYQVATGKTDTGGIADMTVPGASPDQQSRVAAGLYRIEITKAGDNIPAKYNAKTILGREIALDAEGIKMGPPRFDLKY